MSVGNERVAFKEVVSASSSYVLKIWNLLSACASSFSVFALLSKAVSLVQYHINAIFIAALIITDL